MYPQSTKTYHRPKSGSVRAEPYPSAKDRTRLLQLTICLALFLAVFVGRGVFPSKLEELEQSIQLLLTADLDIQSAAIRITEQLELPEDILSDLAAEVLGTPEPKNNPIAAPTAIPDAVSLLTAEARAIAICTEPADLAGHYLTNTVPGIRHFQPVAEPSAVIEPADVPAVGTVLMKAEYTGTPLPENYTLDHLSLGDLETAVPVSGHINSGYGYRDHPIDGAHQFHGGLDIGAQSGNPICAFAAGTVEYVGENSSYGLYLQLDHGNGIKSFYAHCSSVCVQKGQTVTAGETVAKVGSTGAATGPHLHFELKCQGMHVDPAYYLDADAVS